MKKPMKRRIWSSITPLALAAALALAANAAAEAEADKQPAADATGSWHWEHDEQGLTVKDVLRISDDGKGKISATYQGRIGPLWLEDVELAGEAFSGEFDVDFEGNTIEVEFEGKIDGDTINGTVELSGGQDSQSFPWVATRRLEETDVVGTWNIEVPLDNGSTLTPSIAIKSGDGGRGLVGDYTSTNADIQLDVDGLAVRDGKLVFTVSAERDGNTFSADYDVVPRGDRFAGTVAYNFNGQSGQLDVTARRKIDAPRPADDEDDNDEDRDTDADTDDDGGDTNKNDEN
ncbi:MAG: hypothetical protein KDA63_16390 [Planctomycetales bacterium]|nr:hypothetical protein [Planctomycetales bacterium]